MFGRLGAVTVHLALLAVACGPRVEEPTPTVEATITVEEAIVAIERASDSAAKSVNEAQEGVQPEEGHEIATMSADEFVDFTYEAGDVAEFCGGTDELGESVSYDLFMEGAGELSDDRRFEWPTTREVFDELIGRC